ncbi:alpha/beta fold hydrolase [Mycolicibacterium sp.]|uniref:alpha/beta fold hydrolase n=1 Tax=Mycolicibacterium sp. TaxID=2320850 RepID=UPI0037C6095D
MTAADMGAANPALGRRVTAGGVDTNYLEAGGGDATPVVLLHGSGPGVSAYANWRMTIPVLAKSRRVLAPDLLGFGYTQRLESHSYTMESWVAHLVEFVDSIGLSSFALVGNSFGGALALHMTTLLPDRVRRLVLMGAAGVPFAITEGLDEVWGYTPSVPAMRRVLDYFAFDRELVDDDLAEARYRASIQPGFHESYAAMFPAPRQRWLDSMVVDEEKIKAIRCPALIVHGREDRVIPLKTSQRLSQLIPDAQLHVFGQCGHWTQIEHAGRFSALVDSFLNEGDHADN